MCETVVMPDGRWITGVAALEAEGFTITDADVDEEDRDACLCCANVEAILNRSGRPWHVDIPGFYDIDPVESTS